MSSDFELTSIRAVLDGRLLYSASGTSAKEAAQVYTGPLYAGPVPSGDHAISVELSYKGVGDATGFKFVVRSIHAFQAIEGRTASIPERGLRARLVRSRFHAFYNVVAWHMWQKATGAQTATENDSEDITHLMHLAEPAFLLTRDGDLLKSVDASGTYQAPWVRTLEQFLSAPLPMGRPWGISARRQAASFDRAKVSSD